ncbi:MAG: DUF433 domain-containing protein [Janthinobacterium lividum]
MLSFNEAATHMSTMWSGCSVVEIISGKVSGAPVVKGTRLPVATIVDNFNAGVSEPEIADLFDVPVGTVRTVIEFAREHSARHP